MSNTQTSVPNKSNQVLIVDAMVPTADKAVYLNGTLILHSAGNADVKFATVDIVAENLAKNFGVGIEYADGHPKSKKWSWGEIEQDLREKGIIHDLRVSTDNSISGADHLENLDIEAEIHGMY